MTGFAGLASANAALSPIERAQFVWGGYDYCWYDDGWQGPGWYVCDYGPWVSGYWWGGPRGWHNWRWSGPVLRGPYHVDRGDFRGGRSFGIGRGGGDRFVAPRGGAGAGEGGGGRFVAPGGGGGANRFVAPGGARWSRRAAAVQVEAAAEVARVVVVAKTGAMVVDSTRRSLPRSGPPRSRATGSSAILAARNRGRPRSRAGQTRCRPKLKRGHQLH